MKKGAYKKPKVSKVNLKPSETVLTACKGPGANGHSMETVPWAP